MRATHFTRGLSEPERTAIAIRIVRVHEPALRRQGRAPVHVARHAAARFRAPVVAVPQRHDIRVPGMDPRQRDGGLVRLRTAVGEERFRQQAARAYLGDLPRQRHLRLGRVQRRDMHQLVDLLMNRLGDPFVTVTNADSDDPAEKVEVLLAVRVPYVLVFALGDHQRFFKVVKDSREQKLFAGQDDFVAIHGRLTFPIIMVLNPALALRRAFIPKRSSG